MISEFNAVNNTGVRVFSVSVCSLHGCKMVTAGSCISSRFLF